MIKQIVGLEGFSNSGKSTVVRRFTRRLLKQGRIIKAFDYSGIEIDIATIDLTKEYFVLIAYKGMIVLVVTGGDYLETVSVVINVILTLKINIDIAFVAMRKGYPAVGDAYRKQISNTFSLSIKTIFKPGYKRIQELSSEEIAFADELWVELLMRDLEIA